MGNTLPFLLCDYSKVVQEQERERERGRGREEGSERGGERESTSIQYAGGGLLQPVSFRMGGIVSYWGGVETD